MDMDAEFLMQGANVSGQIIALLSTWKNERKSSNDDKFKNFIIWLENHNFHALKERILQSEELARDLNNILREDIASISSKLDVINEAISTVSSHLQGFDRLVEYRPDGDWDLSEQACSILKQFARTDQTDLIYYHLKSLGGPEQHMFHPDISDISAPRFIKADLESLVKFGFLTLTGYTTRDGHPKLSLTRSGEKFAKELEACREKDSPSR